MKKGFGLIILLIGLILIEYGCRDQGGGGSYSSSEIVGISETFILEVDSFGSITLPVEDSVAWDSFVVLNEFEIKYAALAASHNYAAMAEPALPPALTLPLDSIQIWNVAYSDSTNVTDLFELQVGRRTNYYFPISNDQNFLQETGYEIYGSELEHFFRLVEQPERSSMQLYIRYYTTKGEVWETVSEPFGLNSN